MGKIDPGDWDLFGDIASITRWIDDANADDAHESSMRVMKVGEEIGEVYEAVSSLPVAYGRASAAYIGMTGQNPRKGITHSQADVCMELADVAITALCAIAHFTRGGFGTYRPEIVRGFLAAKVSTIMARADIDPTSDPRPRMSAMTASGPHHVVTREPGTGEQFNRNTERNM